MAKLPNFLKVSHEGITSFRSSTCNMSWNVDTPKYYSLLQSDYCFGNLASAECQCFDNTIRIFVKSLKTRAELIHPYSKNYVQDISWYKDNRGLIAQNLFCAITAYFTKLFCAITACCTKPVLSNKPASGGGLIAQNPLPENIARWRKWVLEMH